MAENHDYIALDWVRGEIDQTLSQAQTALESFGEAQDDTTQLTFCLNYIHQVHGSLQMVEFYGAALLAEEMEKLCRNLLEGKTPNAEEALDVLMGALIQLQNYLEHIQAGQKDLPIVLLPALNDIRAAQGLPLLSDTSLFIPDLSAAEVEINPEHNARMRDPQVITNLRKLRQMFQVSLVGVIRNQDLPENLSYLYKVLARLEKFCQGTPIGKIWWVAVGFLDAVQGHKDGLGSATKHLLRELDYLIKEMIEHPEDILVRPLPEDLLKNLLYYVAKAEAPTKRVDELKDAFKLGLALPSSDELDEERQKMMGPNQDTMDSVVGALVEELNQVKDQLDLYVRNTSEDKSSLEAQIPVLNQVANTLAVLGYGAARTLLLRQVGSIESMVARAGPVDDQHLLQIASDLLQVESLLAAGAEADQDSDPSSEDGFSVPVEQFESAHNAVIFESKNGLEQAKNSIVGFIASDWDHKEIEDVPDLLDSIRGGLQIIPLNKAAHLLDACSRYIREHILESKGVPEWEQLDRLADAITSIEYYMERLSAGASDNEKILDVAQTSLVQLGVYEGEADDAPVLSHHTVEIASESPDAQVKESDDALIDEEILSIFVEEVDEVLAAVNDACAKLKSNPEDSPSLQELRRAFHTLKGSGRLVGATQIGDLGWAIENLLNKYLEQNIVPQSDDFRLIDLATERLPSLLTAFSEQSGAVDCDDIYGLTESRLQALIGSPESNEAEQDEAVVSETVSSEPVQSEVVTVEVVQDELEDNTNAELDDVIDAQSEVVDVVEAAPEPAVSAMDDDDDLIDDEILEIFIEEAEEVSETIGNYLPVFLQEFENQEALTELRRAYHTLKGSGRMVGAEDIGETAWAVENMLNRVIDGSILINQDIADVVAYVSELIPNLVEHFKHRTQPTIDLAVLQDHADSLSKGELVPALKNLALESADNASTETSVATDAISEQNSEEGVAVELTADASEQTAPEGDPLLGVDQTLLEIFETEVAGHIASIETFVSAVLASQEETAVDDALSRALHTLKGSAKTASIDCIAEVAVPVEKFIKELRARQLKVSVEIAELMDQALALVKEGLGNIHNAPKTSLSGTATFLESFAALQQSVFVEPEEDEALESFEGQDPQLVSIFLTEGLDILLDAERIIDDWSENPVSNDSLETLCREVKTLQRGAKVAGLESISELCEAIEGSYHCIDPALAEQNSELISVIKRAHDVLINMMDQVAAGLTAELDNQLLAELKQFAIAACDENVELESDSDLSDSLAELDEHLEQSIPDYQRDESENEQAISEDFDDELAEIFLEEAVDIVSGLDELSGKISGAEASEEALQQLERDFHTLKGGARMASIDAIAELAGALENLFNDILHGQRAMSDQVSEVLTEARAVFAEQMEALEQRSSLPSPDALVQRINTLPKGASEDASTSEDILREESNVSAESTISKESTAPESVASHNAESSPVESDSTESSTISLADLDPELVEIFLEEAQDIIDNSGSLLHQWETDTQNLDLVAELQRELHTLKGGARMAEVAPIGDISHELETLFEHIVENRYGVQSGMIKLCLDCHDVLASMVEALSAGQALPDASNLLQAIKNVAETGSPEAPMAVVAEPESATPAIEPIPEPASEEAVQSVAYQEQSDDEDLDHDLLPMFLDESNDILTSVAEFIEQWQDDDAPDALAIELQREMHTLKGGARLADIDPIADLADAAETRLTQFVEGDDIDRQDLMSAVIDCAQAIEAMLSALKDGQAVQAMPELVTRIANAGHLGSGSILPNTGDAGTSVPEALTQAASTPATLDDDLDLEVLEIFVEEARELGDALEEQISAWSQAPSNDDCNRELQRVLHTLKGGARLSNLKVLADESHELETHLVAALEQNQRFEGDLEAMVLKAQDAILAQIDLVEKQVKGESTETAKDQAAPVQASAAPEASESKSVDKPVKPAVVPPAASIPVAKAQTAKQEDQSKALANKEHKAADKKKEAAKAAPQETIRVSSGLMEELVNLAGETSISRGRLETQISDFGFTLEEMSATIERLREQLRRMEMETEAQVLFRAEQEGFAGSEYKDFDPLEMDRYSSIQQLSRSLTESTTDLLELRDALADKARGAETLLLQQSRINSELQEGLMQTRMIPFSSMVPRLRRIARQISGELNKQVNFSVANAEGEMDRTVLERMVAPLEHMLRNALDHGIESVEKRVAAGKPEAGNIRLSLSREGGDVVLRMADDGAGISDQRIFDKAVSQGLISKDAQVSRHEILQLIMLPGFSTAEQVTQISGRGVGMDVVASEIKQMGGSIEIQSELGRGTEFVVRLPFTVSVNRALMVSTGDDFYAIPLNSIEGIVRVSPYELEEYYKPDAPAYEYAGRQYKLQYLGKLLHSGHQPKLQGQPLPLPVILVRGTDTPMALQVDSLMGSREIVVKSLGPQFGGVNAVSGATILGDGSVVVILDLPALIRDESAGLLNVTDDVSVVDDQASETPLVMVVDDSVTVRKVTTRLLERAGMEVITAKDGVDAIAQLQDCKPDVMLLDIEMPRMDGFEVATLVRHDERLKKVPIIMITSRTGQKHRERALSIGVNEYLGKPFQEQELLETIESLTLVKS